MIFTARKRQQDFITEIFNLVGTEYIVLGEYIKSDIKLLMKHNIETCGYEYEVIPNSFLRGRRCPKCSGKMKKNTDTFKQEVFDLVQNEYSVIDEYINSKTKIRMRHNCEKCNDFLFDMTPNSFLRGIRCPKCGGTSKKDTAIFKQEVFDLVKNEYSVLSEYEKNNVKILMKHDIDTCGHVYKVFPSAFLRGSRCPKCFGTSKKDTAIFKQEVFDLVKNEYSVIGEYITNKRLIRMRHNCEDCNNHEWDIAPVNFLSGVRCPICSNALKISKITKNNEDFCKEIYSLVKDEYSILEEYHNSATKIRMRHNCDNCSNHIFQVRPKEFLRGSRCPKCFGTNKKDTSTFKQEVFNLVEDEYSVIGNYINSKTKIRMKHNCEKCKNYEWEIAPNNFLQGSRCPICCCSKGEYTIRKYLQENKIPFMEQLKFTDCKNIIPLRFDFAIFDKWDRLKLLIEYQGEQHYNYIPHFHRDDSGFVERILLDSKKRAYCEYNNIPLLEIPYTEFDRIEEILTNALCT